MGTNYNGEKPQNRVTISKGGDVPARQVDSDSGRVDRSFAQPNPALPQREVEPKAHASAQDEAEALTKNSTQGRQYEREAEVEDDGSDEE